jgi:hypothetical protein
MHHQISLHMSTPSFLPHIPALDLKQLGRPFGLNALSYDSRESGMNLKNSLFLSDTLLMGINMYYLIGGNKCHLFTNYPF